MPVGDAELTVRNSRRSRAIELYLELVPKSPMAQRRRRSSFLMACRFVILLFVTASLLHFSSVSATAENRHNYAAEVTGATRVGSYLRGKMVGRQLEETTSSFEAKSVEVEDYSPCANDRHDPSLCKHP